jgi:hypothetical protein
VARASDATLMAPLSSLFELTLRHRIWRVTLDGSFFGDYRSKDEAMDGVADARRALDAAGRSVKVVVAANESL